MPPPVPPSVNAGRMIAGSPISSSARATATSRSAFVAPSSALAVETALGL